LKKSNRKISARTLAWVDKTPLARQAVYGTIYPADERILINLDTLRQELGTKTFEKYRNLCIAAAVARRKMGLGKIVSSSIRFASFYKKANKWEAAGEDAEKNFARNKVMNKVDVDPQAYRAVSNYLSKHKLLPRQAYDDLTHRTAMEGFVTNPRTLPHLLRNWLLDKKMRLPYRSPLPKVSEYIKYLDSILSIPAKKLSLKPDQKWPLFPVVTAPWPILMPLTKTWPLDEARYIFEKYQGLHGKKRYQIYGPYNRYPKGVSPSLEPSDKWGLGSWPLAIQKGGLCGTMSTIANGTMTSLGIPMLKATQPGHSCTVTYKLNNKGQYLASQGQSINGPQNTSAKNLLDDINDPLFTPGKFAYHIALTQAMNVGLESYMDVRIALHLYKTLATESQVNANALKLLRNALELNPFHLEAWLTLMQTSSSSQMLVSFKNFMRLHKTDSAIEEFKLRSANEDLGVDKSNTKTSVGSKIAVLNDVGLAMMWRVAAKDIKLHNKKELINLYKFVSNEVTNGRLTLDLALDSLACIIKGESKTLGLLGNDISNFLSTPLQTTQTRGAAHKAYRDRKKACDSLIARADNLKKIITDKDLLYKSMGRIMKLFKYTDKVTVWNNKNATLSKLYEGISNVYSRLLDKKDRRALRQSNSELLQKASSTSTEVKEKKKKKKGNKKKKTGAL
ncbi:MAG: hypothetical protein HRT88_18255, partial [Lentisphaeraceae bacterium]|nr:hypothetical protein [Lentisphaeraceae bacterium]